MLPPADPVTRPERPDDRNPFATRFVRPGAIPFVFPPGQSAEDVVARLSANGWWGQIWGDHGTGKSSLLQTIVTYILRDNRTIAWGELHAGQKQPTWRAGSGNAADWNSETVVIIDGFEQLSRWSRWSWMRRCRRASAGLLVTTHHDVGLPTIVRTGVSLELAQQLATLLTADMPLQLSADEVRDCWLRHPGNLREVLFALYDRYELRRRQSNKKT